MNWKNLIPRALSISIVLVVGIALWGCSSSKRDAVQSGTFGKIEMKTSLTGFQLRDFTWKYDSRKKTFEVAGMVVYPDTLDIKGMAFWKGYDRFGKLVGQGALEICIEQAAHNTIPMPGWWNRSKETVRNKPVRLEFDLQANFYFPRRLDAVPGIRNCKYYFGRGDRIEMAVASPFFTATGLKADPASQNPRTQRNVFQTYPGLNELMESYTRILNLTPDQQKEIRAIHVVHYQRRIQDYDTGNDVRNHMEQLQSEVKKVLTPEQQMVYDSTFVPKTTDAR